MSTNTPAQGSKFEFHNGTALVEVGNVLSYGFNPVKSTRDITSLSSTAKEKANSLPDNGTLDLEILVDRADVGQAAIIVADASNAERAFRLTQSDGYIADFNVLPVPIGGGASIDDDVKQTLALEISGAVVWTAP